MRIGQLIGGSDTGGQAGALEKAFRELAPEDEVRSVVASVNFIRYPPIGWQNWRSGNEFRAAAKAVYDWADVVVLTNTTELYDQLDGGQRKPIVIIHRGTRYRDHPGIVFAEGARIRARQVVSTVDLLLAFPEGHATWLPLVTDIDTLSAIGRRYKHSGTTMRIAHAPTNRAIKSTDEIVSAVQRLGARLPVELDLIEKVPWDACLVRKAAANIFVDQLILGYGNNSTEAWGMGIPCVAGATPDILAQMRITFGTDVMPFVEATPQTIYRVLGRLVRSKAAREEAAEIGMAHLRRFHSPEVAVPRAQAIFRSVGPSVGGLTPAEARDEIAARAAAGRYVPLKLRRALTA